MDENPYRSPQVPAAPSPPPWTPNYRSAAFGSVGLTFFTLALVVGSAVAIRQYQQGHPEAKQLVGVVIMALLVAGHVHWVWAALRFGKPS
jgi:hypothetical protein